MTLLLGFVVLVAAEIVALVAVAGQIGVFTAIGLLVLVSLCGPWLVRRAGLGAWRRTAERLAAGGTPDRQVLDGFLLLAAGALICIPGFVTDALGLLLLLPPVRATVRRRLARRAANSLLVRFGVPRAGRTPRRWGGGPWDGGDVVDAGSHRPGPEAQSPAEWPADRRDLPGPGSGR
jgi:UPF0716 protein FxsA